MSLKEPLGLELTLPLACGYVVLPALRKPRDKNAHQLIVLISRQMRRGELAAPKASNGQQGNQKGAENQKGKESSSSGGLLGELMGKNGLGAIKGHSQHGVGLFPVRENHQQGNKPPS